MPRCRQPRSGDGPAVQAGVRRDRDEPAAQYGSSPDSPLEGTGFEPSVPPRKRRPSREAPRPTIVASQDDLCLMTPSNLSVRHLSSTTAERPFTRAGPMVRIRFPPAVSRQTIGSSAAEPHLPFVMSRHPCMPELRATMRKGGTSLSATPEGSATAQE